MTSPALAVLSWDTTQRRQDRLGYVASMATARWMVLRRLRLGRTSLAVLR
jgi:hypothetical protein